MHEFASVFKPECKPKHCYYQANKKPKCDDNTLDLANGNSGRWIFLFTWQVDIILFDTGCKPSEKNNNWISSDFKQDCCIKGHMLSKWWISLLKRLEALNGLLKYYYENGLEVHSLERCKGITSYIPIWSSRVCTHGHTVLLYGDNLLRCT